ncbi:hypothetical protein GCM10009637_00290 [Brevibacterium luteolum]
MEEDDLLGVTAAAADLRGVQLRLRSGLTGAGRLGLWTHGEQSSDEPAPTRTQTLFRENGVSVIDLTVTSV